MTTQCPELTINPAASTDLHAVEEELEINNRIALRRRLDRLINDPESSPEEIVQLLAATEKSQYRQRELSLAERRCEIRLRTIALQEAKMALKQSSSPGSSEAEPFKKTLKTRAQGKKSAKAVPEAASFESQAEAASPEHPGPLSPNPADPTTTTELQAMEWDLRALFDFGDLRPFEFCTDSQIIRFPDRTTLPARPNFPVGVTAADGLSRDDEYVVFAPCLARWISIQSQGEGQGCRDGYKTGQGRS